jgi:hypothetical protein
MEHIKKSNAKFLTEQTLSIASLTPAGDRLIPHVSLIVDRWEKR